MWTRHARERAPQCIPTWRTNSCVPRRDSPRRALQATHSAGLAQSASRPSRRSKTVGYSSRRSAAVAGCSGSFQFCIENRLQLRHGKRSIVMLAVDEERGRPAHACFLAFADIFLDRGFELGRVEVGRKLRHVKSKFFGPCQNVLPREFAEIREQLVVHGPELVLIQS